MTYDASEMTKGNEQLTESEPTFEHRSVTTMLSLDGCTMQENRVDIYTNNALIKIRW